MSSLIRLGSRVADFLPGLGQWGAFARSAADVQKHGLPALEVEPPPHFGPVRGGYLSPVPPMTREEVIEGDWQRIEEELRDLYRQLWERGVEGPTAGRRLPAVPFPAGGGMAFTGV